MKFFLRLLGPLIFAFIILFYVDVDKLIGIMVILDWRYFVLSLVFIPPLILIRSYRWKKILALYNISYSLWQCYKIYFVEMLAVMVIAVVGTFVKIFYLKRDGYGLLHPALSICIDKYFDYILPLIFGLIAIFSVWLNPLPFVGLAIFVFATLISFIPLKKLMVVLSTRFFVGQFNRLFKNKNWDLGDHIEQMQQFLNFEIYIYSVVAFGLYFVSIFFISVSLHIGLNLFQVVLIMTLTSLIAFIPISFLGIGTRDASLVVVFKWFGYSPEHAIALSLTLLLMRIAIVAMGSIFWLIDPLPLTELRRTN